jgi:hypothetical protein
VTRPLSRRGLSCLAALTAVPAVRSQTWSRYGRSIGEVGHLFVQ